MHYSKTSKINQNATGEIGLGKDMAHVDAQNSIDELLSVFQMLGTDTADDVSRIFQFYDTRDEQLTGTQK
ncbi:MAG: hypothetical protein ACPGVK_08925 [Halocynthiibacter sp.]